MPEGFFFESTGSVCFVEKKLLNYLLAFLNTPVCEKLNKLINPTLHLQSGDVAKLPIAIVEDKRKKIDSSVEQNIHCAKLDWDSYETSWDFKRHPMV